MQNSLELLPDMEHRDSDSTGNSVLQAGLADLKKDLDYLQTELKTIESQMLTLQAMVSYSNIGHHLLIKGS